MTIDVAKDRIPMSQRERDLLKIMAPVLEGTRTQAEAARLADLSVRQVRRLQRRLEQDGEGVLVHGLRGKPSNRRLDATMRRQVLDAYRQRFADFGPTFACEKLAELELIVSADTLRRWMEADPAPQEAVALGREAYRMELESPLKRAAKKGNIVAAMFLLKSLFSYRDQGDQSDTANKVSITFELPAALSPEDFRAKVIEHAPENTAIHLPAKSLIRS